MAFKKAA